MNTVPVSPLEAAVRARTDVADLQQLVITLWKALNASQELLRHTQQALGGWDECEGCQAANDECNHARCCDEAKAWTRQINDARRLP